MRAALETDTQYGAVVPPIHLTSTFAFAGFGDKRAYDYSRSGNPTRDALAGGARGSRGRGGGGRHLVGHGRGLAGYPARPAGPGRGRAARLLRRHVPAVQRAQRSGVRSTCASSISSDQAALRAALEAEPALVWIETPSNPLLRIADIAAVTAARTRQGALVVADNTFLSPVWQRPIALGADLVVHSTTKYLNGHSDVVGGAVIARGAGLHEQLAWWGNCTGVTGAPFDSFLTLRGLRTLHARVRAHGENTAQVVALLARHPAVSRVYYPGLASHPGHELAGRSRTGSGRCELRVQWPARPSRRCRVRGAVLARRVARWRGSLVAHPATMTHAAMDPAARATARHHRHAAEAVDRDRGRRRPSWRISSRALRLHSAPVEDCEKKKGRQ